MASIKRDPEQRRITIENMVLRSPAHDTISDLEQLYNMLLFGQENGLLLKSALMKS